MIPFCSSESPEHGGRLEAAVRKWGIPREQWLDLSTGINPVPYPVPVIPMEVWQRLPEPDDGLEDIIRNWAGAPADAACLPVAGSQQAIMALPAVRTRLHGLGQVAVPMPGYREHGHAWHRAGFDVVGISAEQALADDLDWLDSVDVVVWINPNNPTGQVLLPERLLAWRERLQRNGGWLVVDEAFMDTTPEFSVCSDAGLPGLTILRSLGKFYGLAGVRAGSLLCDPSIAEPLQRVLGPWALGGPARYIKARALVDTEWQDKNRVRLQREAKKLSDILGAAGLALLGGTALFQTVRTDDSLLLADRLAAQGVLVRAFDAPRMLRFGLAADEGQWRRLEAALEVATSD
ncbi:Threonine-phosphate decarboxylase [Marinobacter litoralis]|uniref:threonine-phosphate decarboxylase n=1 Tax=Marinobacter litoralis TaxID=187981 RepID=A0A3M2RC53_9GAMM|nr:threonine-phosphate decarboxylase CobD [Marinobacter litoralis]RMJ02739.1 Threonine-phosphate decarboxylase [Marinobacter litoralis]